jgi:hypothetical protein
MSEHEFELQEVPYDPPEADGARLQESVLAAAMTTLGGVGGVAGAASFVFDRIEHRSDREAEREAIRAEFEAQYEAARRVLDIEYRQLVAQTHGLDALDRLDGFGVDYHGCFEVE